MKNENQLKHRIDLAFFLIKIITAVVLASCPGHPCYKKMYKWEKIEKNVKTKSGFGVFMARVSWNQTKKIYTWEKNYGARKITRTP